MRSFQINAHELLTGYIRMLGNTRYGVNGRAQENMNLNTVLPLQGCNPKKLMSKILISVWLR